MVEVSEDGLDDKGVGARGRVAEDLVGYGLARTHLLALVDRAWHLIFSNADCLAQCLPVRQAWFDAVMGISIVAGITVLAGLGSMRLRPDLSVSLELTAESGITVSELADSSKSVLFFVEG